MGSTPEKSKGARIERAAWRAKVQRLSVAADRGMSGVAMAAALRRFDQFRVKRYEAKPGGLGRK